MSDLIPDPLDPSKFIVGGVAERTLGATLENEGGFVLENVHPFSACQGQHCVVHNPSDHHMRTWDLLWRDDKGVMERICPHGVGHPDPDDAAFQVRVGREALTLHGCDGCCQP